jgi:hypothetical protein
MHRAWKTVYRLKQSSSANQYCFLLRVLSKLQEIVHCKFSLLLGFASNQQLANFFLATHLATARCDRWANQTGETRPISCAVISREAKNTSNEKHFCHIAQVKKPHVMRAWHFSHCEWYLFESIKNSVKIIMCGFQDFYLYLLSNLSAIKRGLFF